MESGNVVKTAVLPANQADSIVAAEQALNDGGKAYTSLASQVGMLAILAISVVAGRYIDFYRAANVWSPVLDWKYLLVSMIIAIVAFPFVYKKLQTRRNDPMLVQLGTIFAVGMTWEKTFSTASDVLKLPFN